MYLKADKGRWVAKLSFGRTWMSSGNEVAHFKTGCNLTFYDWFKLHHSIHYTFIIYYVHKRLAFLENCGRVMIYTQLIGSYNDYEVKWKNQNCWFFYSNIFFLFSFHYVLGNQMGIFSASFWAVWVNPVSNWLRYPFHSWSINASKQSVFSCKLMGMFSKAFFLAGKSTDPTRVIEFEAGTFLWTSIFLGAVPIIYAAHYLLIMTVARLQGAAKIRCSLLKNCKRDKNVETLSSNTEIIAY